MNKYFAYDNNGRAIPYEVNESADRICLTLKKELFEDAEHILLLPDVSKACAGDDGFFLLPRNIRMNGELQVTFRDREDMEYEYTHPIFSAYAICKSDACLLVRIERNYKYSIRVECKDGAYTTTPIIYFGGKRDPAYDDVRIEMIRLDSSDAVSALARTEREIRLSRGEITPLADKCREREIVEYSRKHPLIRIRMGWKPSPSPIKHQTVENEPEMYVACTFARVRDIADELNRQGVKGADLQLVGWNISGHDGRFPQIFPVDERLGGEEELKRTVEYVKSLGYRISLHTNWIDSYEIADSFSWDDVCVLQNGEYRQTGDYSGGYAYHVCPIKQVEHSMSAQPKVAALGVNGMHFTDVVSIVEPDTCYSPKHTVYTSDGIKCVQQLMAYERKLFGGFSSEGCFDFAIGEMDFGLYVSFGDGFGHLDIPICDRYVPFHEMVYHGIILYNPLSPTVNYPIKTARDKLTFIMRGGRPSFYVYSKFRTEGASNWMGEVDLTADTDEALKTTVSVIKNAIEEYESLCDKQLLYITDYEFLTDTDGRDNGIEVARYSDGSRIVGNFNDVECEYEGIRISPFGYAVLDA